MTQVADPPPCCWSQSIVSADLYWRPPPSTRCDADTMRFRSNHPRPPTRRTATQCNATTNCRRDALPTRTDAMWCRQSWSMPTRRSWPADMPMMCRHDQLIYAMPYRHRWLIVWDMQLHPTAYRLIWSNQDFLRTDFVCLSVNCPAHTCAAWNQYSSLLAVVLRSRRLTQIHEILLLLQPTVARLNLFCRLSARLRKKSAVKHTLILEKNQIEFSSHFTSLPYEIVRTDYYYYYY